MRKKIQLFTTIVLFASTLTFEAQTIINPNHKLGFVSQVKAGALIHEGFAGEYANISSGYNMPGSLVRQ